MTDDAGDVTELLLAHGRGVSGAFERLVSLVYADLRRLARAQLRRSPNASLDTTALAHEAYLKLVDRERVAWHDRGHFLAVCALAMRQILVDHARARLRLKRGGPATPDTLDGRDVAVTRDAERLLDLDRALINLTNVDPRLVRIVECRYFAGMTEAETADALGVSVRTIQRDWLQARALLRRALSAPTES